MENIKPFDFCKVPERIWREVFAAGFEGRINIDRCDFSREIINNHYVMRLKTRTSYGLSHLISFVADFLQFRTDDYFNQYKA